MFFSAVLAALVATASAVKDERTFAVLHFYGDGPLVTARADPIISPGETSSHLHTIMGGSAFSTSATGESLKTSNCTTSLIKNDLSAYWAPTLFFQSPQNGSFIQVPLFYMNVYYFFEATNDDIKAFPTGLQMVSGDAMLRAAPVTTGELQLDPSQGTIQPTQWTCPRTNYDTPSYPVGSDGADAGIQDPGNKGAGMGLPFQYCDGYASPLRMDLHFPSCYNPDAGLANYKTNTVFPSSADGGKQDCPTGWIHTPHIFFEVYWNTPLFKDEYDNWGSGTPFVLSEGDRTGFSSHGDFIAAWDEPTLQQIIDNCNTGDNGMDQCPGLIGGTNLNSADSCHIESPINENVDGWLTELPGNNPLAGWGVGDTTTGSMSSTNDSTSDSTGSTSSVSTSSSTQIAAASSVASAVANNAAMPTPDGDANSATSTATVVAAVDSGDDGAFTSSVVAANGAATATPAAAGGSGSGSVQTSTVWETVTDWVTVTATDGQGSSSVFISAVTSVITGSQTQSDYPMAIPIGQANGKSVSDVAGYKYTGCFDDDSGRVLAGEIRPDLGKISNTNCVTYCKSKGWQAAGTEYGGQCYCGNTLTSVNKLADSKCDTACEGDASQTCGGGWALSLFTADGMVPSVNETETADTTTTTTMGSSKRAALKHLNRHKRWVA